MYYFDTAPVIEDPSQETIKNIEMLKYLLNLLDRVGMDKIDKVINENDAIKARDLLLDFMKN